jgi:hypothetical protein
VKGKKPLFNRHFWGKRRENPCFKGFLSQKRRHFTGKKAIRQTNPAITSKINSKTFVLADF